MTFARKLVQFGLPGVGIATALLGAFLAFDPIVRAVFVGFGLLLSFAAGARIPYALMLNERRYLQLRREVDQFIWLARELNAAALEARRSSVGEAKFGDLRAAMQESLERMTMFAGRTDEELLREQAELQPR